MNATPSTSLFVRHDYRWAMTLFHRTRADLILAAVSAFELFRFLLDDFAWSSPVHVIYLTMHGLVLILALVRRKPVTVDRHLGTLVLCGISYLYPYLIIPLWIVREPEPIAPGIGITILAASGLFSLWSLAVLGASFGIRPARRRLVRHGPFRWIRHPIYLSYFVSDAGLLLAGFDVVLVLAFIGSWAAMTARLMLEERILQEDPAWRSYVSHTRYRLVPGLF